MLKVAAVANEEDSARTTKQSDFFSALPLTSVLFESVHLSIGFITHFLIFKTLLLIVKLH
ncbi:hypothetical protein AALB_3099 [Agarivorans albus MKT 106]|uniref:Uncharacterized protein n=1 Tax=Agarivorans albus MKT 106 TaxID=1331007 RepID=R9PNT9_AGAAL|nr:hypothetical protein AALB_3099 [Agarivorans albus MKT 106]